MERTLDLDKIYPYNFVQKFKTFWDFPTPKVGVPLESLKNASFSFPQCVDAFFLL
jgi:hypothetical protein